MLTCSPGLKCLFISLPLPGHSFSGPHAGSCPAGALCTLLALSALHQVTPWCFTAATWFSAASANYVQTLPPTPASYVSRPLDLPLRSVVETSPNTCALLSWSTPEPAPLTVLYKTPAIHSFLEITWAKPRSHPDSSCSPTLHI